MKLLINEIIKMDDKSEMKKFGCMKKMSLQKRVTVMSIHNKILHSHRQRYKENGTDELSYCALIIAIQVVHENDEMMKTKNFKDLTLDEIEKLANLEIINLKLTERRKNVREKLIKYLPIMLVWKKKGVSFRKIRDQLREKYNEEASLTSVYNTLKELI